MKKMFSLLTALIMVLTLTAVAEDTAALDAFNQLTGQNLAASDTGLTFDKTPDEYLNDVMTGRYNVDVIDSTNASLLAADLDALSAITTADIASFALNNAFPEEQVRHGYFMALANVLRAEIMVNPASEDNYRNIQIILSLFLDDSDEQLAVTSRNAIRSSMNREYAEVIASGYNLPTSFVEFVIMDEDWDDDDWKNDGDWAAQSGYHWCYDDTPDAYETPHHASASTATSTSTSTTTSSTATPVYCDTPDYTNTPDYCTPDHNDTPEHHDTPDYHTPDHYDTPDHHTPDYDNTPDHHDSPDHH